MIHASTPKFALVNSNHSFPFWSTGLISYFCCIIYTGYSLYTEPNYLFTISLGRITANHSGSGLVNSWSWNSSNFHVDDVLDSSYTDQHHMPLYSLENFASNEVNVITILLHLLHLSLYIFLIVFLLGQPIFTLEYGHSNIRRISIRNYNNDKMHMHIYRPREIQV